MGGRRRADRWMGERRGLAVSVIGVCIIFEVVVQWFTRVEKFETPGILAG